MTYAKILFIGLGGAGQRHLRVIRHFLADSATLYSYQSIKRSPVLDANFSVKSNGRLEDYYPLTRISSVEEGLEIGIDLTIVATPTSIHKCGMEDALALNSSILVEKPWSTDLNGYEDFHNRVINQKLNFHISFQRRYHPALIRLKQYLDDGMVGNISHVNIMVSSYVPEWHPYEDWQNLYAVQSDLGGGALLTEIHEVDMLVWFFGMPKKIIGLGGSRIMKSLDVEDTYQMLLDYENFSVTLSCSFLQKNKSREITIFGDSGKLSWADGGDLVFEDGGCKQSLFPFASITQEDLYLFQADDFLFHWSEEKTMNSLESAKNSLALVNAAKLSMQQGMVIDMSEFLRQHS